ncbi:MAG: hypothetical protein ACK45B_02385 [Limisphaerales bacterium]
MKSVWKFAGWVVLLALTLTLTACGSKDPSTTPGKPNPASFDSAPPDIKADWDRAVAADQANQYYVAASTYLKIIRQEGRLTKEQYQTAVAASDALTQRIQEAIQKGDAAARDAMQRIMMGR